MISKRQHLAWGIDLTSTDGTGGAYFAFGVLEPREGFLHKDWVAYGAFR